MFNIIMLLCLLVPTIIQTADSNYTKPELTEKYSLRLQDRGRTILLEIPATANSTVADVIKAYKKSKDMPEKDEIMILLKGDKLDPRTAMSSIDTRDVFHIVPVAPTQQAQQKTITIYSPAGKMSHVIEYNNNDTVQDITNKYRQKTGLGEKYEILLFEKQLEPRKKISDATNSATLYAVDIVQ